MTTTWLYRVECPQYSIRLKALGYLCTGLVSCDSTVDGDWLPETEWCQCYLPCCQPASDIAEKFGEVSRTKCAGHVNNFELILTIKIKNRNLVEGYFFRVNFRRSVIVVELWRHEVCKILKFWEILGIFGKMTPYDKIFKILLLKFSSQHWSKCCVQILWNLADKKSVKSCVAYLTKRTKFRLTLQLLPLHGSCPKSATASPRMYPECSKFHPNRFTFSKVIT